MRYEAIPMVFLIFLQKFKLFEPLGTGVFRSCGCEYCLGLRCRGSVFHVISSIHITITTIFMIVTLCTIYCGSCFQSFCCCCCCCCFGCQRLLVHTFIIIAVTTIMRTSTIHGPTTHSIAFLRIIQLIVSLITKKTTQIRSFLTWWHFFRVISYEVQIGGFINVWILAINDHYFGFLCCRLCIRFIVVVIGSIGRCWYVVG
mmetsp:Transcript_725/g.1010  ORF Transcript_725/g.1010 Transcript_725/m.1010 type:complete len:201 (+) Transcript_725:908-1510(+)